MSFSEDVDHVMLTDKYCEQDVVFTQFNSSVAEICWILMVLILKLTR